MFGVVKIMFFTNYFVLIVYKHVWRIIGKDVIIVPWLSVLQWKSYVTAELVIGVSEV